MEFSDKLINQLVEEYTDEVKIDTEPLDSDEVEELINALHLQLDFNQGNITRQEYRNGTRNTIKVPKITGPTPRVIKVNLNFNLVLVAIILAICGLFGYVQYHTEIRTLTKNGEYVGSVANIFRTVTDEEIKTWKSLGYEVE